MRAKQISNAALRSTTKSTAPHRHSRPARISQSGESDILQFIETDEIATATTRTNSHAQTTFLERFKHHGTRPIAHPNRMIARSKVLHRIGRQLLSTRRSSNAHDESAGPHLSSPQRDRSVASGAGGAAADSAHVLSPAVPRHHRSRGDALPHDIAAVGAPTHHSTLPNPIHRSHPSAPVPVSPSHLIADTPISHAASPPSTHTVQHSSSSPTSVPSFQFVYYVSPQSASAAAAASAPPPVYPVNTLRNMALQLVRTQLVLMVCLCGSVAYAVRVIDSYIAFLSYVWCVAVGRRFRTG